MEFQFAKRMESFQPGIFNVLNDRKNEMVRAGRTVYNLSVGTPDFLPDENVMQVMQEACKNPNNYKYSLGNLPELVKAVQNWYQRRYSVTLEPDEIMSVNGSQEGIAHVALPLCDPGDLVLCPNPGYPIFEMGPWLCGAEIAYYDLLEKNHYLPDLDAIPEEVALRAKMMVVSYPANPVCVTAPKSFYEKLVSFAKKYNIIILHDNAYSEIVYDGHEGISFLSVPGAKEVGVEFNSLSKTYNLTGARISFVLGNREIISAFSKVRSQIDYGIFLPVQLAAIEALNGSQEGVAARREEYQRRRDALCGGFRSIGWNVPDSEGSMFVWAPIPDHYSNSVEFCMELMERSGLICTPGSAFGSLGEGHVRFALVQPVEKIQEIVKAVDACGILKK